LRIKRACTAICMAALLLLASCRQPPDQDHETAEPSGDLQKTNVIAPYQFTDSEEELLRLVCMDDIIQLFNFSVDDDIGSVTFWCEEYEKGQFIYTHLERTAEIDGGGKIAITIDDKELNMAVAHGTSYRGSGITYTASDNYSSQSQYSRQTEIEPDAEIALFVYAHAGDDQNEALQLPGFYMEVPDRLGDFDRVYLFKCRFREESID